jgi:hypothetical protein
VAGRIGITCNNDVAKMLQSKYLCSNHFEERDFTTAERIHLNEVAVLCGSDTASEFLNVVQMNGDNELKYC